MVHVYTRLDAGSRNSYMETKMDALLDGKLERTLGIV